MDWSWRFIFIWGFFLLSLRITHQLANVALGGVAAQSSLWDPVNPPNLVIDGRPDSNYTHGSCSSTQWEENPWWRLNMWHLQHISSVEVVRRSDCCSSDLNGAEIRIGSSLENNGNSNPRCAVITVTDNVTMAFSCRGMKGCYVNIFLPGPKRRLQLCEVKVYTTTPIKAANVALSGVAAQSSVWDAQNPPNSVIDGRPDSNYHKGSCSSTLYETNPWWRLDLRGPYNISSVEVIQRTDQYITELNGAEIRIGDSLENNGNNNPRCAVITVTDNVTMVFRCDKMTGRYINLFLPGGRKRLQLCEVKVYARAFISGDNVAVRGIITFPQHSTYGPPIAIGEYPGSKYTSKTCSSIPLQDNPWWQLDLMSIYRVTAVSFLAVRDCCTMELDGAEIRIGLRKDTSNQRCAIISAVEGVHTYSFQCGIMEGRYVHVVVPGLQKNLTLCEVQVYGTVLENVAVTGVAFQSSSRQKDAGQASQVIDGVRFSTCSITKDKPSQWVTVDLLVPYNVTFIQLAYDKDHIYSTYGYNEVRVDNKSCSVASARSHSLVTLDCGGIMGRYVTVVHPDKQPPLCEVEVYSTWENPQNNDTQLPPPHDYCALPSCSRDYILIHSERKTWFEAQAYCRERYFDLATIPSAQDMNRVIDKMENNFDDFWIGLYEDVITWRWSLPDEDYYGDGKAEFRNWDVGEPNKQMGVQHCAAIRHTGEWKDLDCDLLHYFLCFDGGGVPETKILVETPMKWTEAQRYCRKHHTDLLSLRKQTENQEVQNMVPEQKLAWIGLFGDPWKWSDGNNSLFRYQRQGALGSVGEPNCAHIHHRKWSTRSCNTKSMFLCYYLKKRTVVRITTDFNMSDPVIQQQVLSQLQAEFKNRGISDLKISWRTSFTQKKDGTVLATGGR